MDMVRYHFPDYVALYGKREISLGGPDLIRRALCLAAEEKVRQLCSS